MKKVEVEMEVEVEVGEVWYGEKGRRCCAADVVVGAWKRLYGKTLGSAYPVQYSLNKSLSNDDDRSQLHLPDPTSQSSYPLRYQLQEDRPQLDMRSGENWYHEYHVPRTGRDTPPATCDTGISGCWGSSKAACSPLWSPGPLPCWLLAAGCWLRCATTLPTAQPSQHHSQPAPAVGALQHQAGKAGTLNRCIIVRVD